MNVSLGIRNEEYDCKWKEAICQAQNHCDAMKFWDKRTITRKHIHTIIRCKSEERRYLLKYRLYFSHFWLFISTIYNNFFYASSAKKKKRIHKKWYDKRMFSYRPRKKKQPEKITVNNNSCLSVRFGQSGGFFFDTQNMCYALNGNNKQR